MAPWPRQARSPEEPDHSAPRRGGRLADAGAAGIGAALGLVALVALLAAWPPVHLTPLTITTPAPLDFLDAPNPSVGAASFSAGLVQSGTTNPYTGYGAPGILLRVDGVGSTVDWTLAAWANETTPPAIRTCASDSVFFDNYDWTIESNNGNGITFATLPSTIPARLGPAGDQCVARIGATGTWHVTICIEGKKGGPLGIYDAPDGRRHKDSWDICIDQDFKVPS